MRRLALAAAVLSGCNNDAPSGFATGPGVTTFQPSLSSSGAASSTSTSTSSTSTGSGGEDSAASSSGAVSTFDMAPPPDLDDPTPEGCKGKIDFMFLISAMHTMRHEQAQLLASFPGFVETIAADFAEFDTHIMSVNTDGHWRGEVCESPDWCLNQGHCGENAIGYECGKYVDQVGPCDKRLGAGLVFNAGPYAYNKPCDLDGNRYIAGEQEPEAFECIAQVGTLGDGKDTKMADSLVEAVSPKLNGPDGCNAGFLRPDALLVVVFIADTDDENSWLSANKVYEAVVAAKGGDDHAIVALAVIPQLQVGEAVEGCVYDSPPYGQHLRDVIGLFPYREEGDICADNYAPFFNGAAASLVHDACNAFIPQ
ncbi:hypothetical protein [Nannocystis exedens]|nr:hypothetical protein [Nannocystis exedens]